MKKSGKRELAVAFEKLGQLLQSGILITAALDVIIEECDDKKVAKLLRAMHTLASSGKKCSILPEGVKTVPKSIQLLWRAGEKTGQVEECCFRIAKVLKAELN
jgi:type II secretory pathway component PulF